jgi:ubiquinone/menaquinone biosynthesis C-methylase UbiE
MSGHADRIRQQFTQQAIPFATSPAMSDADALRMLVDFSGVTGTDTMLDVACGPGLIVAAFAKHARQVTGIDVTPAMIDRAVAHCAAQGLDNVRFHTGDAQHLPFADRTFSLVVSRFAFHHMEQPQAVLAEMARVCAPRGRILLVDGVCADDVEKAAAFNNVERIRDPSHVEFRPVSQVVGWFTTAGMPVVGVKTFPVPAELEGLLARSFPAPGGVERIRDAFAQAVETDAFGVGLRRKGREFRFAYPAVAVLARNA